MYSIRNSILGSLAIPGIAIACFIYGFYFGLTAPYLIVAFVVPIAVLCVLIIWALPDQRTAPTLGIEFLLPFFFVALILWPNYLAVSLPGVPWITLRRLIGLPLAGLILTSLSVSPEFRRMVSTSLRASGAIWTFLCAFSLLQVLTTFVSPAPGASAQAVFNDQVNWTFVFIASCVIFNRTEYIEKYWKLLCLLALPIVFITWLETKEMHILWVDHIPAILRIQDPSVQVTLSSWFRPGINLYRAKATFSTPLALAEYLSLLTPFLLHFVFWGKSKAAKVAAFAMIPLIFFTIRLTDARLGVVGMLVSLLLYGLLWSIVRWRSHPKDLFAAAIVYLYPALFLAGIAAVFKSHQLHAMVFGDGAQASSSEARDSQLAIAIPKLLQAPWGHGTGQSGDAMGYAAGSFVTVDNYFITIAMDYGVLGLIAWYGLFIVAMVQALRYSMSSRYGGRVEARLLAPLGVALGAFLVIKWVHGQDDNHPLMFMMLGMISALIFKLRQSVDAVGAFGGAAAPQVAELRPFYPAAKRALPEPPPIED